LYKQTVHDKNSLIAVCFASNPFLLQRIPVFNPFATSAPPTISLGALAKLPNKLLGKLQQHFVTERGENIGCDIR